MSYNECLFAGVFVQLICRRVIGIDKLLWTKCVAMQVLCLSSCRHVCIEMVYICGKVCISDGDCLTV